MGWIKEMEEKYATLSSADIFNFLLDYINFQETLLLMMKFDVLLFLMK